jgi:hypothetical protein
VLSENPGSLNFMEHLGPFYTCTGMALPFNIRLNDTTSKTAVASSNFFFQHYFQTMFVANKALG